jgi:hypothetical protein
MGGGKGPRRVQNHGDGGQKGALTQRSAYLGTKEEGLIDRVGSRVATEQAERPA